MKGSFRDLLGLAIGWLSSVHVVVSIGPELRAVPVLVPEPRGGDELVPKTESADALVPEIEDGLEL